jgi:hypothetical protein
MVSNAIFAPNKTKIKTSTMKKVFAILAVAGLMTACSNGEKTEAAADTTATTVDTTATTVDTTAVKVDTTASADTTKKM